MNIQIQGCEYKSGFINPAANIRPRLFEVKIEPFVKWAFLSIFSKLTVKKGRQFKEQAFAVAIGTTIVQTFALATATMQPMPIAIETTTLVVVVCGLLLSPGLEKNMFRVFQAGFIEFNSIQTQCKSKQLNT